MSDQAPDTWHDLPIGRAYPLPDDALFVPLSEADRKAIRSFWRGIVVGGLIVGATFIWWAAL